MRRPLTCRVCDMLEAMKIEVDEVLDPLPKHGGKREGAGRKPAGFEPALEKQASQRKQIFLKTITVAVVSHLELLGDCLHIIMKKT